MSAILATCCLLEGAWCISTYQKLFELNEMSQVFSAGAWENFHLSFCFSFSALSCNSNYKAISNSLKQGIFMAYLTRPWEVVHSPIRPYPSSSLLSSAFWSCACHLISSRWLPSCLHHVLMTASQRMSGGGDGDIL